MFSAFWSALVGRQSRQRRGAPQLSPGIYTPHPSHSVPSSIMSAMSPMLAPILRSSDAVGGFDGVRENHQIIYMYPCALSW